MWWKRFRSLMVIIPALITATVVIVVGVSNYDLWGSFTWWQGVAAGLVAALVWHANSSIPKVLGFLGFCLLFAIAIGAGENLSTQSRAFFNGMSLMMPVGYAISAWWRWDRFRPFLLEAATRENHKWLLRLLGELR